MSLGPLSPLQDDIEAFYPYLDKLHHGDQSKELKQLSNKIDDFKTNYRCRILFVWNAQRTVPIGVLTDMESALSLITDLLKQNNAPKPVQVAAGEMYTFVCKIHGALAGANLEYNEYPKTGPKTTSEEVIATVMKDYIRYKLPAVDQAQAAIAMDALRKRAEASTELERKNTELERKNTELEKKNKELETKYTELETKYTELQTKYTELQTEQDNRKAIKPPKQKSLWDRLTSERPEIMLENEYIV
jgi:hypothetical protein